MGTPLPALRVGKECPLAYARGSDFAHKWSAGAIETTSLLYQAEKTSSISYAMW
jgi:hypothetical protein